MVMFIIAATPQDIAEYKAKAKYVTTVGVVDEIVGGIVVHGGQKTITRGGVETVGNRILPTTMMTAKRRGGDCRE